MGRPADHESSHCLSAVWNPRAPLTRQRPACKKEKPNRTHFNIVKDTAIGECTFTLPLDGPENMMWSYMDIFVVWLWFKRLWRVLMPLPQNQGIGLVSHLTNVQQSNRQKFILEEADIPISPLTVSSADWNAATRPCVLSGSVAAITHWLASYIYTLSPCKHLWLNVTSSLKRLFEDLQEPYEITSWSSSRRDILMESGFTKNSKLNSTLHHKIIQWTTQINDNNVRVSEGGFFFFYHLNQHSERVPLIIHFHPLSWWSIICSCYY